MSAEEKETYRVNIVVSELDKKDGITVKPDYKNVAVRAEKDSIASIEALLQAADVKKVSGVSDLLSVGKKSVIRDFQDGVSVEWVATSGNVFIKSGTKITDLVSEHLFEDYNNVTVEISLTVDKVGVDGKSSDDVDDRTQETYLVKLERGIGSDLFTAEGNYTINKGDDLAKLVKEGEYTALPGLYDVEFDKDGNEYVYQYTIEDDTIYGRWVKEGSPLFGKVEAEEEKEYDELDANKDGVVSCEEALGKGWVWNNETSACELKGSSNTGSYVPNTATK